MGHGAQYVGVLPLAAMPTSTSLAQNWMFFRSRALQLCVILGVLDRLQDGLVAASNQAYHLLGRRHRWAGIHWHQDAEPA